MMMEINSFTRLKQQLSKEHIADGLTLTNVPDDFYPDVNSFINESGNNDVKIMMAKFKRIRLTKMVRLVSSFTSYDSISDKLSPEEQVLYCELLESAEKYWRLN